ncbi:peptidoglycan binding protein CsiV [Neiella marina]|uniref:Peptidoglycan binding protein CsiV n=1 Tax=Neiella holothuriorum TaxID=2870530 RepID=A0ABS7EDA5_9GAMM|nr:CsiV family protein [Neiella holothuriorum]MBW8190329.1 peptidoglycan binding protein CsiV [Neiella holothuriorum]
MNKLTYRAAPFKPAVLKPALLTAALLGSALATPSALARWFEVEVILFSRTEDPTQLDEDFEASRQSKVAAKQLDLFAAFLLAPDDCPQPEPVPLAALADEGLSQVALPLTEQEIGILGTTLGSTTDVLEPSEDAIEQGVQYDEFGFPIAEPELEPEADSATAEEAQDLLMPEELEPARTPEEQLAFEQWLNDCQKPRSYDELTQLPVAMTPHQIPETDSQAYLLTPELLQLTDARRKLANGGAYKPMLHAGWRINIDSKRRMPALKLIAGQNFGARYSSDGWEHPIEEPMLLDDTEVLSLDSSDELSQHSTNDTQLSAGIENTETTGDPSLPTSQPVTAIQSTSTLTQPWQEVDLTPTPVVLKPAVWELEANLHIWLANWLHVETDMVLRRSGRKSPQDVAQPPEQLALAMEPTSTLISDAATVPFLFSYQMAQFRRVRSQELHYFDHPMMGMLVQIRPYEVRPDPEPETDIDTSAPAIN